MKESAKKLDIIENKFYEVIDFDGNFDFLASDLAELRVYAKNTLNINKINAFASRQDTIAKLIQQNNLEEDNDKIFKLKNLYDKYLETLFETLNLKITGVNKESSSSTFKHGITGKIPIKLKSEKTPDAMPKYESQYNEEQNRLLLELIKISSQLSIKACELMQVSQEGINIYTQNELLDNLSNLSAKISKQVTTISAKPGFIRVRSLINENFLIAKNNWVVAMIIRKDQKKFVLSIFEEYAFLLMEGVNKDGKVFIGKYKLRLTPQELSTIDIIEDEGTPTKIESTFNKIVSDSIFNSAKDKLTDPSVGWYKKSWAITREQAIQLQSNIEVDKLDPPAMKGLISFEKNDKEVTYTDTSWAAEKLHKLGNQTIISDLQTAWTDRLTLITPKLTGQQQEMKSAYSRIEL